MHDQTPSRAGGSGGKRRRVDHGKPRFTERDGELLALVGEQHALTLAQLARACGISYGTASMLRDRWRRASWIESHQLLWYGPSFLWLTREGARVADSPFRAIPPSPARATHIAAVTDVRLLLERELRLGTWVCERDLARRLQGPGNATAHLPDAVLDRDGLRIAIEVELTLKGATRLDLILDELARRYPEIWYFVTPRVEPTIRRLVAEVPWRNIHLHPFPPSANGFGC